MSLRSFTIYDMYKRNATLFRNKGALQSEGGEITFEELLEQVRSLAGSLMERGVAKGDRIAVLSKNCPQFFQVMGAVAGTGSIMVPINFRLSADEIGFVLADTEPLFLFLDPDFEKMIFDLRPKLPFIKEFITFGAGKEFTPFESLMKNSPGDPVTISEEDPFMIMHTAAVQGRPRGALISHRNLMSGSIQVASALSLTDRDVYLDILPLFHIAGFVAALAVMHMGGKNVIISKFDPKSAGKIIDREAVSFIGDFPPILAQLLDAQSSGECGLASLRKVMGVEIPETVRRFESLGHGKFWLVYGQTETMGWTCLCLNEERPGSAGKPGPLLDLKIVDEFDREVQTGKPGEIVVRGPLVFQGYWKEEGLTKQTFRGGWHHTGDMGRVDEDGYLWFAGRKAEKELIKTGGENVYPVEVEKAVLEHPGVEEVSVIGVPDPKFGEGIRAVCVLKPGVRITEQELIDFVATRIARYKKPGSVSFADSLPRRSDGSIDREKVKTLYGKA